VGKRIPTVNYSLTKEIGTYAANGLALVEFKFMTTSVLYIYLSRLTVSAPRPRQARRGAVGGRLCL